MINTFNKLCPKQKSMGANAPLVPPMYADDFKVCCCLGKNLNSHCFVRGKEAHRVCDFIFGTRTKHVFDERSKNMVLRHRRNTDVFFRNKPSREPITILVGIAFARIWFHITSPFCCLWCYRCCSYWWSKRFYNGSRSSGLHPQHACELERRLSVTSSSINRYRYR